MSNEIQRVAVVTSGFLPVPNVLGGAVEALDTMMVKANEQNPKFRFTVFSTWTEEAENEVEKTQYKYTNFVFIRTPLIVRVIDKTIYSFAKWVLHKDILTKYRYIARRLWYIRKIGVILSRSTELYDKVMIENHPTLFMAMKYKNNGQRYAGRVYYHLHNELSGGFGVLPEIAAVKQVMGVSQFIVDALDTFLVEHGLDGLREEQKSVWRNGVDTTVFGTPATMSKGAKLRRELHLHDDDIIFLFTGRFTPEKGIEQLLEAFTQIHEIVPKAKLVVAGAFSPDPSIISPFEARMHEMVAKLGDRVIFTGQISYQKMPSVYALCDVCVMPSIWDDPAPLAIIESLASGKPIITTKSGGIPEYVTSESAIILNRDEHLVDNLASAMVFLASDKDKREEMAKASFDVGRNLDVKNYMRRLCELIK